ncbi:hypothetical protein DMENIID0001_088520 [Sergentomyia squamirostris]
MYFNMLDSYNQAIKYTLSLCGLTCRSCFCGADSPTKNVNPAAGEVARDDALGLKLNMRAHRDDDMGYREEDLFKKFTFLLSSIPT